jgi:hypothetical protein
MVEVHMDEANLDRPDAGPVSADDTFVGRPLDCLPPDPMTFSLTRKGLGKKTHDEIMFGARQHWASLDDEHRRYLHGLQHDLSPMAVLRENAASDFVESDLD